jgi:DNA-binding transcriptional LysR family regulator
VVAGVDEVLYRVIGRALGRRPTVREPGADEDPMRWYSAPDVSRSAIIAREELRRA